MTDPIVDADDSHMSEWSLRQIIEILIDLIELAVVVLAVREQVVDWRRSSDDDGQDQEKQ